jgi:hypothetical protein
VYQRPVVNDGSFEHFAQQDGVITCVVSRMVTALQLNDGAIDHRRSPVSNRYASKAIPRSRKLLRYPPLAFRKDTHAEPDCAGDGIVHASPFSYAHEDQRRQ